MIQLPRMPHGSAFPELLSRSHGQFAATFRIVAIAATTFHCATNPLPAHAGPQQCDWATLVPAMDPSGGTAPFGRLGHSAIVDAPRERLVIFAGDGDEGAGYVTKNDLWSLSLAGAPAWTEILPGGTPPRKRRAHTAIFDAPRNRMIVFGGIGFNASRQAIWPDDSAAVFSLSLDGAPAWSVLEAPAALSHRYAHAAVLDPVRQRMWVYGGADQIGSLNFSPHLDYLDLVGTPAWVAVTPTGAAPPGLAEHVLAYDSLRDRLLLFGGIRAFTGAPMQDVWQLPLTGPPTWSQLIVSGTAPQTVTNIRGFYDPVGDQLIIVGPTSVQALVLSGTPTWRPARTHPQRFGPAVAYDSAGVRVLAMGGENGPDFNDVLEMDPPPTVRWSVTPEDSGVVIVDYHGDCPETVTLTAVPDHGYEFSSWSGDVSGSANPISFALGGSMSVAAHFVASTATLISRFEATRIPMGVELRWSFGDPSRIASTAIDRRREGETAWRPMALAVLPELGSEVAIDTDASPAVDYEYRLRVVLETGDELIVGPVRATAAVQPQSTTIESVSPNPSPGRMTISFALAREGRVKLAVLDVAGREMTTIMEGQLLLGRYQASWDGAAAGRPLPAGVYFAQLATEGRTIVRKLVFSR